jgi:hypothetical protein
LAEKKWHKTQKKIQNNGNVSGQVRKGHFHWVKKEDIRAIIATRVNASHESHGALSYFILPTI